MARAILHGTLVMNWPCQNGSSYYGTQILLACMQCQNGSSHSCRQVMPCTGRTRMARAILALKVMQLAVIIVTGSARMAQAIMALKYCWQCKNGMSYSCTPQVIVGSAKMPWHASNATGRTRMALAILALMVMQLSVPEWLEPLCMALNWPCKNGSCYSAKASYYSSIGGGTGGAGGL